MPNLTKSYFTRVAHSRVASSRVASSRVASSRVASSKSAGLGHTPETLRRQVALVLSFGILQVIGLLAGFSQAAPRSSVSIIQDTKVPGVNLRHHSHAFGEVREAQSTPTYNRFASSVPATIASSALLLSTSKTVRVTDRLAEPVALFTTQAATYNSVFLGWVINFESDIKKIELHCSTVPTYTPVQNTLIYETTSQGAKSLRHSVLMPNTTYHYKLLVTDQNNQVWETELAVTTDDYKITALKAGDYIVPGSRKNRVEFKVPGPLASDEAKLKVYKESDPRTSVRSIDLDAIKQDGEYSYIDWDGKDDAGNPLTENNGPYILKITYTQSAQEFTATISNRKVKEWGISLTIMDRSSNTTTFESGVDEETLAENGTPKNLHVGVYATEGDYETIPYFGVTPDTGNEGWDAELDLKKDSSLWYLFYTCPTNTSDVPAIKYNLTLTQSDPYVQDVAGNSWDWDGKTKAIDSNGLWVFHINPLGEMAGFTASYW